MLGVILKVKSPQENTYLSSYLDKIKLIEKVENKRIIFIGEVILHLVWIVL